MPYGSFISQDEINYDTFEDEARNGQDIIAVTTDHNTSYGTSEFIDYLTTDVATPSRKQDVVKEGWKRSAKEGASHDDSSDDNCLSAPSATSAEVTPTLNAFKSEKSLLTRRSSRKSQRRTL